MPIDHISWTKYTYVCDPDECDSLVEYTCGDTFGFPSGDVRQFTCPCGRNMQLVSVVPATILPMNERNEMNMTDTMVDNTITELQNNNSTLAKRIEGLEDYLSRSQGTIRQVIDNLSEDGWYNPNVDKEDVLRDLCEIVDYQPKKEISFSGTITFRGRIDLPLDEAEDFDLEDYLSDISVDIYNGDVVIDGYELENVWEE